MSDAHSRLAAAIVQRSSPPKQFGQRVALPAGKRASLLALAALSLAMAISADGIAAESGPAGAQLPAQLAKQYEQEMRPLLATYCSACHGADKHKGDVDFSQLSAGPAALAKRELWHNVSDHLANREMPPEKERKQPSAEERTVMLSWLGSLKYLDPPDPGKSVLQGLARTEYVRTLSDLLGIDFKGGDNLDKDAGGDDAGISPLLMEKYLLAADAALDQVVVDDQLACQWSAGQLDAILEGKPDAARKDESTRTFAGPGEVYTTVLIPIDGSYTIKVKAAAEQAGSDPARIAIRCDGQVIEEQKVLASRKAAAVYVCKAKLAAGRIRLAVNFVNPGSEEQPKPAGAKPSTGGPIAKTPPPEAGKAHVRSVTIDTIEIIGPPAGPLTDAHKRIFISSPGKEASAHEAARAIIGPFALRAFRRPPTATELERLLTVFDLADRLHETFSSSVKLMLKAVLVSPQFLYRTPEDRPALAAGIVAVGDFELASRLSYFLWSTMPDEALFAAARDGSLHQPAVLSAQLRRMIRDPKARALADNFAAPWLGLDHLANLVVDDRKFPLLTKELRQAMYDEGTMLFEGIMREDRSLLELIDCNYTYVNAALAKWYGMPEVKGTKLQKVELTDANRGGVLTLPGVLTVSSMPTRTSPVKRGKWVLEQILGGAPPPPPPNVAALERQDTPENAQLNVRQKTERHRSDPACASCHRTMDAIGFGLENFDAIGRWRERDDNGGMIDSAGELPGNQHFSSPAELKRALLARKADFIRVLAGKLLAYALGRGLSGYDEVVLDRIVESVAQDGYKCDTLLIAIATSYPVLNTRHTATGGR